MAMAFLFTLHRLRHLTDLVAAGGSGGRQVAIPGRHCAIALVIAVIGAATRRLIVQNEKPAIPGRGRERQAREQRRSLRVEVSAVACCATTAISRARPRSVSMAAVACANQACASIG